MYAALQEPGPAAAAAAGSSGRGSPTSAADMDDDIDEGAIWQEVQRRQREEERVKAEAAAAGSHQQQAAIGAPPQQFLQQPTPQQSLQQLSARDQAVDVGNVQAASAARLPAEPAAGAAGSCRLAFRLPDGSRVQRRFNSADTIGALQVIILGGYCFGCSTCGAPAVSQCSVLCKSCVRLLWSLARKTSWHRPW